MSERPEKIRPRPVAPISKASRTPPGRTPILRRNTQRTKRADTQNHHDITRAADSSWAYLMVSATGEKIARISEGSPIYPATTGITSAESCSLSLRIARFARCVRESADAPGALMTVHVLASPLQPCQSVEATRTSPRERQVSKHLLPEIRPQVRVAGIGDLESVYPGIGQPGNVAGP